MSPDEFDDLVELPVQVLKVVFLQTSLLDHGLDALLLLENGRNRLALLHLENRIFVKSG